ncbi:glycosyltransferase family 2 protein [Acidovorax sp.]|uniref:glycosyltransferase family 2 protein n=1 Tax=Acidovorax sp. TaxID=1872122 RepID=UPI0025C0A1DA|nr:glycosyltransferase family 2 protein [Acidovorax sp.]
MITLYHLAPCAEDVQDVHGTRLQGTMPISPARTHGGKRLIETAPTSTHESPLISVITVIYNGAAELRATIESVLQQKRSDIEYIVFDGGSTDGTCDVLHEFNSRLDYWISEPDAGIYDAMNKAINLARGQFIYHLNIGDRLLRIPGLLDETVPEDVVCIAGVVQTSANGLHIPSAGVALRFHNTLHHQGCFYRKTPELRYDLRYKVFSDFDLNQRLLRSGGKIVLCSDVVAVHDSGGISHTTNRFFEVYGIVQQNFGPWWVAVCFAYFKYRGLLKRLRLS